MKRVYRSMEQYRRAYYPSGFADKPPYDNPEKFGRWLAKRHAEMIRKALEAIGPIAPPAEA